MLIWTQSPRLKSQRLTKYSETGAVAALLGADQVILMVSLSTSWAVGLAGASGTSVKIKIRWFTTHLNQTLMTAKLLLISHEMQSNAKMLKHLLHEVYIIISSQCIDILHQQVNVVINLIHTHTHPPPQNKTKTKNKQNNDNVICLHPCKTMCIYIPWCILIRGL